MERMKLFSWVHLATVVVIAAGLVCSGLEHSAAIFVGTSIVTRAVTRRIHARVQLGCGACRRLMPWTVLFYLVPVAWWKRLAQVGMNLHARSCGPMHFCGCGWRYDVTRQCPLCDRGELP